jgi:hypothetical protein
MKREKIQCPRCKKMVATKHWAPGYPGLWKHNGEDDKHCPTPYVRESKVDGRWIAD